MSGRTKSPLYVQAIWKSALLIYWFQKYGIAYPTRQMIKIYPKRRLFNNKNDLFFKWGSASRFCVGAHHHFCKRRMCYGYMRGRPDRAEGTLYVQSTCMNVQGRLCTVTPKGIPCTRPPVSNSEWNAWTQMRLDGKQSCASKHMN